MRTNLDRVITCKQDAIDYLTDLHNNGEAYHCDDSAEDIEWGTNVTPPTPEEVIKLDSLMDLVFKYHPDPCEVLVTLWQNEDDNNKTETN